MQRIGVLTVQGVSLKVVSEDIANTARKLGYSSDVIVGYARLTELFRNFDKFIMFLPFDTHYMLAWLSAYHTMRRIGVPVKFYTTIEGYPDKNLIPNWLPSLIKPIANSKFTANCLNSVGIQVEKIVYHGVNMEYMDTIYKNHRPEDKLKKDYVLFGSIGFGHPRKGWDKFEEIVKKCIDKLPQAKFLVITGSEIIDRLSQYPNVIEMIPFGSLDRDKLLEKIASIDFYLCPSLAEGFGLPILESQSLGVPCIHADYEPLSEISCPENLKVRVTKTYEFRFMEAVNYIMHEYSVNEMIERMSEACDMLLNNGEKYLDLSAKVREHARNFDCIKVYKELVE